MRKLLSIFLCIISLFLLSACGENKTEQTHKDVVINLPEDDTVNGYRTEKSDTDYNDIISADEVGIDNSANKNSSQNETQNSNSKGSYCANKNSGVFHKIDCGSVSKMKESNKAYFKDRNTAVSNGYKPCGNCEP